MLQDKEAFKGGTPPTKEKPSEKSETEQSDRRLYVCSQWKVDPKIRFIDKVKWDPPVIDEILRKLQVSAFLRNEVSPFYEGHPFLSPLLCHNGMQKYELYLKERSYIESQLCARLPYFSFSNSNQNFQMNGRFPSLMVFFIAVSLLSLRAGINTTSPTTRSNNSHLTNFL